MPAVPGYSLTWSDDFEGPVNALPNPGYWIVDTGTSYPGGPVNWGTWEVQSYTNSITKLGLTGDGQLRIIPINLMTPQEYGLLDVLKLHSEPLAP